MIIGTRQALFLPFVNLKHIIVIDPLHEFYKSDMSPKYWTPELRGNGCPESWRAICCFVSPFSVLTLMKKSLQDKIQVRDTSKSWPAKISVIDLTSRIQTRLLCWYSHSERAGCRTPKHLLAKKKFWIVSARRGYSGILLCQRCGLFV